MMSMFQQARVLYRQILVLTCLLTGPHAVLGNAEGDALYKFAQNLKDPENVFTSWDPTLVDPCTWMHITCGDDAKVHRVDIAAYSLGGPLVPALGSLPALEFLELHNNAITGQIPVDLGNLSSLVYLDLYNNQLTGAIPVSFARLSKLKFLRLHHNALTGAIPVELTKLPSLIMIDLSYNSLSGTIPKFATGVITRLEGNPGLHPGLDMVNSRLP